MRIRLGAIYPARMYAGGWFGRVCEMGRMVRPLLAPFEKYETRRCKSCAQKCHVYVVQIKWRLKITIFHRNKNLQRSHALINICFKQNLIICEKKTAEKGRIIKVRIFFLYFPSENISLMSCKWQEMKKIVTYLYVFQRLSCVHRKGTPLCFYPLRLRRIRPVWKSRPAPTSLWTLIPYCSDCTWKNTIKFH